jgi:multisubunit Na+/H+ antiporter MnhC subunit
LTVADAARDARSPEAVAAAANVSAEAGGGLQVRPRGRAFGAPGVTAGAAVVAGILLLTRDQSVSTLGTLAIVAGALALVATAAAVREWPWAPQWTGPNGALDGVAGPMAWLAVVFAAIVVLTHFVPIVVPAWSEEQVFAVAVVAFVALSVLGWGPGVSIAWPSGLRLSSLTVLGSLVALVLVGVYLVFMVLLRADAVSADDREWARLVEIRATLEALAFAAAGALLGTIVQRQAVSGELRALEEEIDQRDAELSDARAVLATRELEVDSMRSTVTAALRQLTPQAPDDLEQLDPDAPAVRLARPSSGAVHQTRRTLLEGLKILAAADR